MEKKTTKFYGQLALDVELSEKFKRLCREKGVKISDEAESIVKDYLIRNQNQTKKQL